MLLKIREYKYQNKSIQEIRKLISNYSDIIMHCIIHGSYSDNEIINYSDFDGLLILNGTNNYYSKKRLKKFIYESHKLIYKLDPLQHHSWFIINKSDLINYPQSYLPYEILENSSVLSENGLEINIVLPSNVDYLTPFLHLNNSLVRTIEISNPKNLYQLKSFLSGLMLMPCLYLQAKQKKGYTKKESFEIAKKDFTESIWQPIEKASQIREMWDYKLNPIQKYIMTRPHTFFRKLTKYYISPKIPPQMKIIIEDGFYDKSLVLLDTMKERIGNETH